MAYILPRTFIVLIGWGITCAVVRNVWSSVDSTIFYVAGASWILAGILWFGYVHKLRRELPDRRSRF